MKESQIMRVSRRSAIAMVAGTALATRVARSAQKGSAFGLIGDRHHNSDYIRTALNRTIQSDLGVNIDFCDETKNLTAEALHGYKLLIILRDGSNYPDGYNSESDNAGWVGAGKPALVSDPPVPPVTGNGQFWMKPEQGKAVRQFVEGGGSALFLHNSTHIGLT